MSKLDEIRERVNSTDPDKPIVMPWERDDFNYLLAEVERLQAELAQYKAVWGKAEFSIPSGYTINSPRYRALGNAVCVNVVRLIAQRMIEVNSKEAAS
jgi:site-specific DNA-cytosine methylase